MKTRKDSSAGGSRGDSGRKRATGAWSEAATRVLRERYLLRDPEGTVIETPDELVWRVSRAVAEAEKQWADPNGLTPDDIAGQFYDVMVSRQFLPNSPTLMNAGKGNNLQLSACYVVPVPDSLEGIFDAVKHAALIHQSGGGCISGDAHVFTTFCGVETIATLYDRVRATGRSEEVHSDHAIMDVRDMNIRTMALNPVDGSYEAAQITHLWRYDVALENQARVSGANGLEVTTSCWHPFMVFDGGRLVERRADELAPGDILLTPNASVRERWPHANYRMVAGVQMDEEIAWLIGYYLGDGNLGWAKVPTSEPRREKLRWRVFDGRTASLERARDILARRFGVTVAIQRDARGVYSLATTNAGFIATFQGLIEVYPGPKKELPFPEMVAKSPLTVVGAFLAGLVDSDGYVDSERDRVTFTTASEYLARKVHTLCSLLGLAPALRARAPQGKGKVTTYEVKLASEAHVDDLRGLIGSELQDSLKSTRLAESRGAHEQSTATRLPVPFAVIEDILQSVGIVTNTTAIHREPITIGEERLWLHRWKEGLGVSISTLRRTVVALQTLADARYVERLALLERVAQGATTVVSVEPPAEATPFYDFTVAEHSTYLAGVNGLTAIHNTGFSFSRLRAEGSMVASTHGVASGPVSFMKIFDGATEAVKQGGCVTPDTRVSTSAGMVQIGTLGPLDAEPKSWHALNHPLSAATDEGQRTVEEFYHNGVAPIRRIRTTAGYHFAGTLEHRVRVIDESGAYVWRHLKDVRAGDWVALQKYTYPETTDYQFPVFAQARHFNATPVRFPERPTAELGEFIGYFIGDGSINYYNPGGATGRLTLTVADSEPEVGARLLQLARDLFGLTPLEHRKPNDASVTYFFNATELVAWLKHIGVTKTSALTARVPEIVFQAGAEFARGFVRGLFSADGSISSEGYSSLYSVSRELIDDTQQLLLALGVPTNVSVITNREDAFGNNPLYRLRVTTSDGLREYAERIGFMSIAKTARLDAGLEKAWEFNDVLPNQAIVMAGVYQGPGRGSGPERGSRGANRALYRDIQHYLPDVSSPRSLTRSRLRTLAEKHSEIRDSALSLFLTNGQFYDQVMEIEDDEALTVDLSVAENHTYIANGFVSHNSRRGANMGILRVDHPDILKFIDCKRDGSVTNFNISVAITDEFMRAYEADSDYALIDPHTREEVRRLRARDVMERIIDAAWATGDPGLVFLDRANRSSANPTPEIELLEATNPCLVGETRLATSQGLIRMDSLYASGQNLVVTTDARSWSQAVEGVVNGVAQVAQSGVVFQSAAPVFRTGIQVPVRKLTTSHGMEITATPNHRFLTTEGYKRLDQLEFGDTLLLQSGEGGWATSRALPAVSYGPQSQARLKAKVARGEAQPPTKWSAELGEVLGYALGDGYVRRGDTSDILGFAVAHSDDAIAIALRSRISQWFGAQGNRTERQGHTQLTFAGSAATFFMALGLTASHAAEKRIPDSVFAAPRDAVAGFVRGLFSADGSVQVGSAEKGTCSVRLATSSKGLALDMQQLLLNFGIVSAIRLRREASLTLLPNSQRESTEYAAQAQYEVIIDKANRDRFASEIGFMQPEKQTKLAAWIGAKKRASNHETFTTKVALIEDAGLADVYDTTVADVHSMVANGITLHNCGEQYLGPYDACNLGSINLGLFVHDGEIDWAELERVTRLTTRFLDDVIDINPFPLEQVREKVHSNRRIGLGVMGWAEMLFEMGLRYDSEEATMLGQRVMRAVHDWSTDESARLAEVRGPFTNFSRSIYKHDSPLRNATRTTVAPTGSISILADCSSGIEPIFALAFQHRVKQPDGSYRVLDFVNPFFQRALEASDIADKEGVLEYVKANGALHGHPEEHHPALRPYVTAHDIAPEWHIRMQAAFQQGVDNSISKTINLPNWATREDVGKAYMQAWATGCLGITVFRDGCKGEQVLNVGVKAEQAGGQPTAPSEADLAAAATALALEAHKQRYPSGRKSRPEVMQGYTRQVRAPEGKVNVTLNSDDDGILEVFINIGKAGSDVAALAEALGRLISIHLQIDSSLTQNERADEVAHQLRSIGGSASIGFGENRVRSLPDAVGRALELHIAHLTGAAQVVDADAADTPATSPIASGVSARASKPAIGERQRFTTNGNLCPTCGNSTMYYEEGCKKCVSCGYSEC